MPFPNLYKKNTGSPGLGVLVSNGIQIGVDGGFSGYSVDYGPTGTSDFYPGITQFTGTTIPLRPLFSISDGGTCVFTSLTAETNTPYFTFVTSSTNPSGASILCANFINPDYSFWGSVLTMTDLVYQIRLLGINNVLVQNYSLPNILTSGLTQIAISNYLPSDYGLGDTGGTRTIYDLSLNQQQIGAYNLGDTRVRGSRVWPFDGVDAYMQLTSTTTYATSNFTWIFGATFIETAPGRAWLMVSASGGQKNFSIYFQSANTTNCNMVIETNTSSYSSTTVGTNYDGFSGTGPATVSNAFSASRGNWRGIALVKNGTTFSLYLSGDFGGPSPGNATLKWQVTINDWSIVNSGIVTDLFRNPVINDYSRGGMLALQFYNRVLNLYEIRQTMARFYNMDQGLPIYPDF